MIPILIANTRSIERAIADMERRAPRAMDYLEIRFAEVFAERVRASAEAYGKDWGDAEVFWTEDGAMVCTSGSEVEIIRYERGIDAPKEPVFGDVVQMSDEILRDLLPEVCRWLMIGGPMPNYPSRGVPTRTWLQSRLYGG